RGPDRWQECGLPAHQHPAGFDLRKDRPGRRRHRAESQRYRAERSVQGGRPAHGYPVDGPDPRRLRAQRQASQLHVHHPMRRRLLARTLLAAVAAGVVCLPVVLAARAHAEDADNTATQELPVPADKSKIVMNFENVDLTAFIKFISKVTGRNIVFGDKIEGTVSVVSPTPVNVEQAFAMFQSVLATQGLTTVDEGAVMRIVATKDARTAGTAVLDGGARSPAGFATRLIPLRYVNAGDIARVLAPQVS